MKKKIAMVGASRRGCYGFAEPLLKDYSEIYEVCGVFDIYPSKLAGYCDLLGTELPSYTDFDLMMKETRPDTIFVSTVDSTHSKYIVKGLEYGVNCISEKPLCTDLEQCRELYNARLKYPDPVAVTTHNCRYRPDFSKVKEVIDSGEIGDIIYVNYLHMLHRKHGASYFRRWNRDKKLSGGLLVHKSSHHFDLINWFVDSVPVSVSAFGGMTVFGPEGSPFHGEKCSTCEHSEKCPQRLEYKDGEMQHTLFFKHNSGNDYTPDLCVFSPEIKSEDFASVSYRYENGVQANYCLNGYCPYTGWKISIEGKKGRLEIDYATSPEDVDHGKGYGEVTTEKDEIKIISPTGKVKMVEVEEAEGGHGGSDPKLFEDLFVNEKPSRQMATLHDGIQAVVIGAAANISIEKGTAVNNIQEIFN